MKIHLVYEAQLREAAGESEAVVQAEEGTTVEGLLRHVSAARESLAARLIGEDDRLQSSMLIFVNDKPITRDAAMDLLLADGDIVLLIPPISGG